VYYTSAGAGGRLITGETWEADLRLLAVVAEVVELLAARMSPAKSGSGVNSN